MKNLFQDELRVINIGLTSFGEAITDAGGYAVNIDWSPPAGGDPEIGKKLAALVNLPETEAANQKAYDHYLTAQPVLQGVGIAGTELPDFEERMILHAGPPIAWESMCGPMQGAIIGAILYEGWAKGVEQARALATSGEIVFDSCHHHAAVGPMSGIISPSMPVWIVENPEHGNRSYSNFNEGLGKVLRFGANSPEVIERLKWMEKILAPTLQAALRTLGQLDVKPLIAQALHMGDEVHNRNTAASSLLLKQLIPAMLKTDIPQSQVAAVVEFLAANDHFFLNISMASCKAMLDAAAGVAGSSMVTAMSRNGVKFGIRISGIPDTWFTAAAPVVDGLLFPGYSSDDAAPDLGDSTIAETAGLGGFSMAASPAIVQFVGGAYQDAIAKTREMSHITLGKNNAFTLPALNFGGAPSGIDIRKVVDTGIEPVINTGIAHRKEGIGQIGAGITRAPMACFTQAVSALADRLNKSGTSLKGGIKSNEI